MRHVFTRFARLNDDRRGVTALEYGLVASLIAIAIVTAVTNVGSSATAVFTAIAGDL